ncbi:MAG TPA: PDZ domain-containing protein [Steroidobacteraceae bacterium]|nr:PDZ domain-containing protein [Steroidobacteraceae bacterium]
MTLPRSAILAAFILAAFGIGTAGAKDPALSSLTMEHFKDTATVAENQKDGTTVISTENGYVEHTGPMRMVWHDEYLLGVLDPRTGTRSLQVFAWVIYTGNFRNYESANYGTPNGPRSVPVNPLARQVVNCPVGDCTYTERLTFPVDEESMRQIAAARVPGNPGKWSFKLVAKSGPEYAGEISGAEIAGLLAKIDEYASGSPVVQARTPGVRAGVPAGSAAAADASLNRDFGIGGMPVDASEEQPKRAGVLVTGVKPGSVAHRAGIIVGDILYEFDGHPLKTPADLQAALAGRASESAIAIRLYRGTNDTAVSARF